MNKKMLAALAAILLFALAAVAGILHFGMRDDRPEEKKPAQEAGERQRDVGGKEDRIQFQNLENIYYLSEEQDGFKKQAADFLEENGIEAEKLNALEKYKDNPADGEEPAEFYMQADDEGGTIIKVSYDKGKDEYSFSLYDGVIENIEDYGGVPAKKDEERAPEPEYETQGLEEMDFGFPAITDNEGQLAEVETDMDRLSGQVLKFLASHSEERRNLSVLYAAPVPTGYEAAILFENPRKDGKYLSVYYDAASSSYRIEFQE